VDDEKKEYDYSGVVSRIYRESEFHRDREDRRDLMERVEDFWSHLPQRNQAIFCRDGLVRYEDMLVIDDKGDVRHKFPHVHVDFDAHRGPFAGHFEYIKIGRGDFGGGSKIGLRDWKRIRIFPDTFGNPIIGTVHLDRTLKLDADTYRRFVKGYEAVGFFVEVDGKHDFLVLRDIIRLAQEPGDKDDPTYVQITHKRTITLAEYVKERGEEGFYRQEVVRWLHRDVKDNEPLSIFEFKRTHEWKFGLDKRLQT
jgi:hypothetical protein